MRGSNREPVEYIKVQSQLEHQSHENTIENDDEQMQNSYLRMAGNCASPAVSSMSTLIQVPASPISKS